MYFSMVSRSRMLPESCKGMSSPTSLRMDLMAEKFCGLPANAPLRSTRCRRRAPLSSQLRAIAAGSSPKVVAWSISPCLRRTQWPSLRSMAGIRIMAGQEKVVALRLPVEEIAEQGQALVRAFFRVKLGCKNIVTGNRTGKAATVVGLCRAVGRMGHLGIEAVHKIVPAAVR